MKLSPHQYFIRIQFKGNIFFIDKQKFESTVVSLFEGYFNTRADSFENQISKTEE